MKSRIPEPSPYEKSKAAMEQWLKEHDYISSRIYENFKRMEK